MPVRQSLCVPMFRREGVSDEQLLAAAGAAGYAAVEIWGRGPDFGEFVAAARRHGLAVASMCGHGTLASGLNNPANHDRIEAELRASIEVAAAHGVAGLICFSGNRLPHQSDEAAIAACVEGLRRVAPFAEARGVTLNMELLNSKLDHAGYQCDHTAWGLAVVQRVRSPRVKLLYDIYHMQIMEGDVIATIQAALPWIGHFHTAGVPGRADLDDQQELHYAAICRAIAAGGYPGYVGHEFRPRGDVFAAIAAAHRTCAVA